MEFLRSGVWRGSGEGLERVLTGFQRSFSMFSGLGGGFLGLVCYRFGVILVSGAWFGCYSLYSALNWGFFLLNCCLYCLGDVLGDVLGYSWYFIFRCYLRIVLGVLFGCCWLFGVCGVCGFVFLVLF